VHGAHYDPRMSARVASQQSAHSQVSCSRYCISASTASPAAAAAADDDDDNVVASR